MTQAATFAHHDRIAAAKPGVLLMTCDPIRASYAGDDFALPAGTWLRVRTVVSGVDLYAEVAIEGKVQVVVVPSADFGALDFAPDAKEPTDA